MPSCGPDQLKERRVRVAKLDSSARSSGKYGLRQCEKVRETSLFEVVISRQDVRNRLSLADDHGDAVG